MKNHPEQQLQASVVKFIRTACPDITVVAIPNGGFRRPIEAMMMKAGGVSAGVPDLMLLWKPKLDYGRVGFIELKINHRPSSVSTAQRAFLLRLTELEIPNGIATSIDEVLALLKQWGAPVRVK